MDVEPRGQVGDTSVTFTKGNKLGKKYRQVGKKLPRKKSIKSLTAKADAVFSQYIRHRDADGRGNVRCFTCSKVAPIKEMQCGHFVSRIHKSLRWDERNANTQCVACNMFNEGKKDVYAVRLIEKYGQHILFDLHQEKQKVAKWTVPQLEALIEDLKKKIEELSTDVLAEAA